MCAERNQRAAALDQTYDLPGSHRAADDDSYDDSTDGDSSDEDEAALSDDEEKDPFTAKVQFRKCALSYTIRNCAGYKPCLNPMLRSWSCLCLQALRRVPLTVVACQVTPEPLHVCVCKCASALYDTAEGVIYFSVTVTLAVLWHRIGPFPVRSIRCFPLVCKHLCTCVCTCASVSVSEFGFVA